jgi:hypothetical protein
MAQKKQREKLLHHYFDRATKQHRIHIYNKEHTQVADLTVTPTGIITIYQGQINSDKEKQGGNNQ